MIARVDGFMALRRLARLRGRIRRDQLVEQRDERRRHVGRRTVTGIATSPSSLAIAFGASRRSRTFCDSRSSSPRTRAVPRCTVIDRMPRRTRFRPQAGDVEQGDGRARRRPVAVFPLGADVVDVGGVGDRGEPAVRLHAHVVARDVVAREVGVDGHVDGDVERLRLGSPFSSPTASVTIWQ